MSEIDPGDVREVRELIAFCIGDQDFCVDIIQVREIRGFAFATPLPHTPSFVCGVINLRGTVLPIVDLASRLGFGRTEPTARSVIIVVMVQGQMMGLLVDAVSDILTVTDDLVQPTPEVSSELARSFVRGVMAIDGRMISQLSLDDVLPRTEMAA
ncbi:chemotaxis protein CheW [Mangrovibrevibacter kandeliae]|uniref:chemotaxis protein CheW n=1 Tax=Mangrovibrevibacter kandeliae TaxID=2968473 RepID=UPI0021197FBF|nr:MULTISPECIES: chemotaxis protein CheW [unclassified Aurantimonas]MCQ8784074.1 chemotaxis protein CheW [Aurantimonas sp. CSK15Z-1]MCW4116793.1 chemotaxis protein CheW [Aurantimonas sp. MSK8Z-1]